MVSKFIKRGTNKDNVWEHGNMGQFWKGTRTPLGDPLLPKAIICILLIVLLLSGVVTLRLFEIVRFIHFQ